MDFKIVVHNLLATQCAADIPISSPDQRPPFGQQQANQSANLPASIKSLTEITPERLSRYKRF
jgi:hypothetical protein